MNALEVNERVSQTAPVSKVDLSAYIMSKCDSPKSSLSDSKSLPNFQLDNSLDGQKRDPDAGTPNHRGDKYEQGRGPCFPQPKEQTKGEKLEEAKKTPDGKPNKIDDRRFENSQVDPQSKTELIESLRKQIDGLYKLNPSGESLKK